MARSTKTVLDIPAVDVVDRFFADLDYLGGVDYRYGWNVSKEFHSYVVVFRDGVRSHVRTVTRSVLVDNDEGEG